ncbi:MAG TPA: MFS transporter [Phycisphaerae bacterium]|nr:MFS transporter [Phycisphaerae bacterium]
MGDGETMTAPSGHRPMDYAGRSIGPLRLAGAMKINILGGSFIMMALAVLWPTSAVTVIFLDEHLGASKTQIGLNLTFVTLATLCSLPGAWLFSRLQRRKATWMVITAVLRACMFGCAIVALLAGHESWRGWLIAGFMFSLFLVQAGTVFTSPGWWTWMADLIPESIWGSFFGRRYRWLLLAQSFLAMAAGRLLDCAATPEAARAMFFWVFVLASILAVVDPLLFILVPEPVRPRPPTRTLRELARDYAGPLRDRAFRRLLLAAGVYGFFFNMPLLFLVVFLRGENTPAGWIGGHASLALLSLVTVTFAVGTALAANAWGRLADRIGHRIVWILESLGYCSHVSFFFINEHNYAWLALGNAIVFGLLFSGQPVAMQNLALSMAPREKREFYTSMFLAVIAAAGAPAPWIAGWLADRCRVIPDITLPSGQPLCYVHLLLIIAFVGMLLTVPLMTRVPDPRGIPVRPWFGRLVSGDLLRMAWNITALGTAVTSSRKVRGLRRIAPRDGNVLLPEIVGTLDDADPAVRHEALLALGRLGTPEALDLLRWYLHEPDAVTRAHSVEAISQAAVPDRLSLLTRALHDPDSRVRRVAVEALGRTGGHSAAAELRRLLTDERDGEVLASTAVALSRIGEFAAIREILHLALQSEHSAVRSQMLIALADLLGSSGRFHKLWRQDRYWRGAGFATLARKLRRQARAIPRAGSVGEFARSRYRAHVKHIDERVEHLLEEVQEENWPAALTDVRRLAFEFIVLRYHYQGDERNALEFLSAVAPDQAEQYWLITYLRHNAERASAPEAPWDGLTLLALYVLVHGQPPT